MSLVHENFKTNPDPQFTPPTTYPELRDRFGDLIRKILLESADRRADLDFDGLHSFVWQNILEGQLLSRFQVYYANRNRLATEDNFRNYLSRAVYNYNALWYRKIIRQNKATATEAEAAVVLASAVATFADRATGIVARMGKLNLDTPIREFIEVRHAWVATFVAFGASTNFSEQCRVLIQKVVDSPEHLNYRALIRNLGSVPFPLPLLDLCWWLVGYPRFDKGVRLHPSDFNLVKKFKRDKVSWEDHTASGSTRFFLELENGQTALIIKDTLVHEGHIGC